MRLAVKAPKPPIHEGARTTRGRALCFPPGHFLQRGDGKELSNTKKERRTWPTRRIPNAKHNASIPGCSANASCAGELQASVWRPRGAGNCGQAAWDPHGNKAPTRPALRSVLWETPRARSRWGAPHQRSVRPWCPANERRCSKAPLEPQEINAPNGA